jgi:redox-sensitive bicupin YhaK (pirin superfamily)
MIQVLRKSDQFNTTIFNGRFLVNKPVASGTNTNVAPYSNLFYWSHAVAIGDCEFGLHPHKGFEIMTFILEGNVTHYDTATNVWTPLTTGDFQIIQSNRGIQHQERISKGTRSFQIWFDPDFNEAVKKDPTYVDYHNSDFQPVIENGIKVITYVGSGSQSFAITPQLTIKRLILDNPMTINLPLNNESSYTFYILKGSGILNGYLLHENDVLRITEENSLSVDSKAPVEIFYIQTPTKLKYQPIWEQ